jgi:polyisoprenoid-binding protein YceI
MSWEFDPAHTLVEFSVKHMMVTTVKGRFKKFSSTLNLDEQHPDTSTVEFSIDAASIDTGDEGRDGHLRSPDFFDVQTYPAITFKSSKVEPHGQGHYHVTGDLTMHGVTRPITVDITQEGKFTDLQGNPRYSFTVTGTLNRKDFGLNWNVALEAGGVLVSDRVNINIEAQVKEAAPVTANA